MDYLLYWLDRGGWLAPLQHAWIWASVTALLALTCVVGIAMLAHHYDGQPSTRTSPQA